MGLGIWGEGNYRYIPLLNGEYTKREAKSVESVGHWLWEEEGFVQDDSQGPGSETRWTVGLKIEFWNLGRDLW